MEITRPKEIWNGHLGKWIRLFATASREKYLSQSIFPILMIPAADYDN